MKRNTHLKCLFPSVRICIGGPKDSTPAGTHVFWAEDLALGFSDSPSAQPRRWSCPGYAQHRRALRRPTSRRTGATPLHLGCSSGQKNDGGDGGIILLHDYLPIFPENSINYISKFNTHFWNVMQKTVRQVSQISQFQRNSRIVEWFSDEKHAKLVDFQQHLTTIRNRQSAKTTNFRNWKFQIWWNYLRKPERFSSERCKRVLIL